MYNTFDDKIELSWLTITGNHAGSQGGGMVLRGGETIGSLLVTGNSDGHTSHAPDCLTLQEGPTSSGYNLIGAIGDEDCVFTGDTIGNQIGVAIKLSQVRMVLDIRSGTEDRQHRRRRGPCDALSARIGTSRT